MVASDKQVRRNSSRSDRVEDVGSLAKGLHTFVGRMTRRQAISTAGKAAIGIGAAAIVAGGLSAYYQSQSSTATSSSAPRKVRAGFENFGPTSVLTDIISKQKLDTKYNLQIDYTPFSDVPTLASAFVAGAVDALEDGPLTVMANARAQGRPIKVVYPVELASTVVLVRSDSPYNNILDLRGKKFGAVGNPPSTLMVATALYRRKGVSVSISDFNIAPAGPPILLQQLKSGQIEAAESFVPFQQQGLFGGGLKVLTSVPDMFNQLTGSPNFLINGLATTETYLQEHGDIIRNYIKALSDGLAYLQAHPEVTKDYWTQQKVPVEVIDSVVQDTLAVFKLPKYDTDYIRVLNEEVNIFYESQALQKQVTDLFTNAYNP